MTMVSEKTAKIKSPVVESHPPVDDIEVGEVRAFDEAQEFLDSNNINHAAVQLLLEDTPKVRRVVRRIDKVLMPLLCGTYVLQYIDKQCLSYAAVFDLLTDTSMTTDEYAMLTTIFYLGYLVAEYPWSYAAQKYSVSKVVAGCVISWGSILMIAAASHNYAGLAACRVFLGVFEAPITPCFMMIVGMWYTRQEQPIRAGAFYCCNGVGSMIGGILTYAVGQEHDFPVWKAIFILCGGVTICWGVLLMIFLPGDIMSAKRLSVEDKAILIGRGRAAQTGILNRTIRWSHVREVLCDAQVWILFIFVFLNELINGGIASFGKLIIKAVVGNNSLATTALSIPQGGFQVFFILSGTYLATLIPDIRTIIMAIWILPTIIGVSLLWKLPRTDEYGLLLGYYISGAYVCSLVLALQMPATNLGGYTKRVTATAFVFLAYCLGNIIGPHAFLASEAPVYETGCKMIVGCAVGQVLCCVALRTLLTRRNKQRDEAARASLVSAEAGGGGGGGGGGGAKPDAEDVLQDLTDFENPHFRYVL